MAIVYTCEEPEAPRVGAPRGLVRTPSCCSLHPRVSATEPGPVHHEPRRLLQEE